MRNEQPATPPLPWWRVGMVWLVLAGPLAVVLAGAVTAVIAVSGADPAVHATQPGAGDSAGGSTPSAMPAVQARNHAAAVQRAQR